MSHLDEIKKFTSADGVVFTEDKRVLLEYPSRREEEIYIVPEGVVEIGKSAFKDSFFLREVVLPRGIVSIGKSAFAMCVSLEKIILPEGLLEIDDYAFEDCVSLCDIAIPESFSKFGKNVFKGNEFIEIKVPQNMSGSWYYKVLGYDNMLLIALSSFEKGTKLIKYICRDKKRAIQKLIELNKIDLIPAFLEKSPKIKLIELNEIIEIVREAKSTEANAILLDYKKKHYTTRQQELLDQRIVNIAMGKRDLTVAEYKMLFDYSVIDGEIKINKVKIDDPVIEIPEMIGNKRVTMIGKKAIRDKKQLQRVILPKHIKAIGEKAFEICHSLSSINLPNGIKSIDRCAFFACLSLERIDLPTGLEVIENDTFGQCESLKEIKFPKGLKRIGNMAFYNCTSIKSVSLPNSLLSIGCDAFAGCKALEEITLPDSLKSVGECAFYGCSSLKTVTIKSKSVRIGKKAFTECKGITTLSLPRYRDPVARWYFDRFDNVIVSIALEHYDKKTKIVRYICSKWDKAMSVLDLIKRGDLIVALLEKSPMISKEVLKAMYERTNSLKIKDYTPEILKYECLHYGNEKAILEIDHYKKIFDFYVSGNEIEITRLKSFDQSVEVPERIGNRYVTIIGPQAFKGCRSLRKLILPSSIKAIKKDAFYCCDRLEEINLTEGIEKIDSHAFDRCKSLKSIRLPSTIKSIGIKAFKECKSLCDINIPSDIEEIGQSAFENCTSLKGVIRLDTIRRIGEEAFRNCTSLEGLVLPQKISRIKAKAFENCTSLQYVDLSEVEIPHLEYEEETYNLGSMIRASMGRENSIAIEYGAFQGCESLTRVSLPSGPEDIEWDTFRDCRSLKYVSIPEGYKRIAEDAFCGCIALEEITLPSSIVFLDNKAFNECSALKNIKRLRKEDN